MPLKLTFLFPRPCNSCCCTPPAPDTFFFFFFRLSQMESDSSLPFFPLRAGFPPLNGAGSWAFFFFSFFWPSSFLFDDTLNPLFALCPGPDSPFIGCMPVVTFRNLLLQMDARGGHATIQLVQSPSIYRNLPVRCLWIRFWEPLVHFSFIRPDSVRAETLPPSSPHDHQKLDVTVSFGLPPFHKRVRTASSPFLEFFFSCTGGLGQSRV